MRQDIICIDGNNYPLYRIQTIVIGSGAAGLNAAVSLYKEGPPIHKMGFNIYNRKKHLY